MSTSFVEDLWSSVFTPGPTRSLLVATNATFAALQLVLFLLLVATYSIHFVVLSFLSGALWWSINWFAKEVQEVQARQEEEKRHQEQDAIDKEKSGASRLNTSAEINDSETETELEEKSKTRRRRVNQSETTSAAAAAAAAASTASKSGKSDGDEKKGVEGESSGYTSTDSEWEKVDKDRSA